MKSIKDAIDLRSSTRGYSKQALEEDIIKELLLAGLKAPTGANKQELHFTVVKGDAPILAELERDKNAARNIDAPVHNFYYEAPIVIFISGDAEYKWTEIDAGIAVENIALLAEGLGLGSLIIGCVRDTLIGEKKEYYNKAFAIPCDYEFKIAIAVGYKAVNKEQHTFEFERQVTYL